jgi:hypothetical protein
MLRPVCERERQDTAALDFSFKIQVTRGEVEEGFSVPIKRVVMFS